MTTINACGSGLRATRGRVCIRHSPVLARAAELDEPANERSSAKGGRRHSLESTATAILDPSRLGPVSGGA